MVRIRGCFRWIRRHLDRSDRPLIEMKKGEADCGEKEVEGRVSLVEKKLTSDG